MEINRDENMSLKDLQAGAKELTGQNSNNQSDEETTPTVGGNWWEKANITGNSDAAVTAADANTQHQNDTTVTGPVLPNDGNNIASSAADYEGPGVVINKNDIPAPQQAPKATVGLTPDALSGVDAYLNEMDKEIEKAKEVAEEKKAQQQNNSDEDEEDEEGDDPEEFQKKYDEAVVIIDKTGMGTIINFTDEEREKLERVKKIKLEEVETIEVKTFKTKKAKKGSLDKILKRQPSIHTTPIVLPASGYTAIMRGCSTYELMGLMTDTQNVLLDTETKWSLVHSKVDTTSIGTMDFNTFLQHTAAVDYNVFIYGILCATYPDVDKIPLKCENKDCKKQFDHEYTVKSLIRAEKMSEKLQDLIVSIIDASHSDDLAKQKHSNSAVNVVKTVKLPMSGYLAECYVQSAYDFIYRSIKGLSENKDPKYNQASVLSSVVKTIYVPDPDEPGTYVEISDALDIAKVIYTLKDTDILVITKQGDLLLNDLSFEFGLMNVTCPHCKKHTVSLPMDIESILFYKYQQAMTTTIE